uniref:hypothetical protein n=1 Tax=Paraliobacillus zengyii TaxID=2213194 RepID=UPI0018E56E40
AETDASVNEDNVTSSSTDEAEPSLVETEESTSTMESSELSADDLIIQAQSEVTASGKLALYSEGYQKYPDDIRFKEGIQQSAQSLLDWAKKKQNSGDFISAIDRYQYILSISGLNETLQNQTEKYLKSAEEENKIPLADSLFEQAINGTTVSGIFHTFVEGYNWYPTDTRFTDGIQSSGQALFDWATRQHDNERYETAIDRYEVLLEVAVLNDSLRAKVEQRLVDAQNGKRSADILYEEARTERTASGKVALYIKGYEAYPDDNRFKDGIQTSVESLLNWARGKQNSGDFATAIDRYQYILSAPGLNSSLQDQTQKYLTNAEEEKAIPLADDLYLKATKGTTVSGIFLTYVEGNDWYPNDTRFTNGIQSSGQALFDWATRQHDKERYDTAIERYDMLLEVAVINDSLQAKIQQRLVDAQNGKRAANVIYEQALTESSASGKVALYIEGYEFYPKDTRFQEGIKTSTLGLHDWATRQHASRAFDIATDRYNYLLEVPTLSSELRNKVTIQLEYSSNNQLIPSADGFVQEAELLSTLSSKLDLLIDGYLMHEENETIVNSINDVAASLLVWASNKHKSGDYETARSRYEAILAAPGITEKVALETEIKLNYAENGNQYPTADVLFADAENQTSASKILEAYVDGYTLYPNDTRFIDGINEGAQLLLTWATKQHQNSQYATAIDRYDHILDAPGVDSTIKKETEIKRSYAV